MAGDRHELTDWRVARAAPGSIASPGEPGEPDGLAALDGLDWTPMRVPGTVAGALREVGRWDLDDHVDFDADDWWFRTMLPALPQPASVLRFEGLATIADVWVGGRHVLHSEDMYLGHDVAVQLDREAELVVVCRSLRALETPRRPRARWRTRIVELTQLRWVRTTLLGRMPSWTPPAAPVGPWRPVTLLTAPKPALVASGLAVRTGEHAASITVHLAPLDPGAPDDVTPIEAVLHVGDHRANMAIGPGGPDGWRLAAELVLDRIDRWSPHTHGRPALHDARLEVRTSDRATTVHELGRVGFRRITAPRPDGGFGLTIDGVDVFCRGACWTPLDPVSLQATEDELRDALEQVVRGGMNMVRITGTMVVEDDRFYDLCDELGILVWHDFPFANLDYPIADEGFAAAVTVEATAILRRLCRHPCLAVLCGGSEVEQQAGMTGLDRDAFPNELARGLLPALVSQEAPDVPYVPCSPSGGTFAFTPREGVAHYYGVGAYLRPLEDARRAGVRFASECLAFANVPARATVEALLRPGEAPGPGPRWKARVPRDRGTPWDFEDVRDHYVRELFGVDPVAVRWSDPERWLDLGRAAVHHVIAATIGEWRRPGSTCNGAIVLMLRDLWPGAGWGLVDATGLAKSAYHGMRVAAAPLALVVSDEGLNGLDAHVVNDRAEAFTGTLRLRCFGPEDQVVADERLPVAVAAHASTSVHLDALLHGFRDLSYAFRFGPPAHRVTLVELLDVDGCVVAQGLHLPGGPGSLARTEIGLTAHVEVGGSGAVVEVAAARFAHDVHLESDGWEADDDWFHLAPGGSRRISMRRRGGVDSGSPRVTVRAINAAGEVSAVVR